MHGVSKLVVHASGCMTGTALIAVQLCQCVSIAKTDTTTTLQPTNAKCAQHLAGIVWEPRQTAQAALMVLSYQETHATVAHQTVPTAMLQAQIIAQPALPIHFGVKVAQQWALAIHVEAWDGVP